MQRVRMRSVFRTLFLVGSLLSLTGCFNKLDTRAVEREIESEIESQSRRISIAEVRCPRDIYRQSGAYFRCVGYLRPEGEFTINVTQQDSQGNLEWDVPNSQIMLNLAKIEEKLQEDFAKQFSKRAFLDCGEQYRINQPGQQFECEVVGGVDFGQEQVTALLVRVDPEGNLNWYEVREATATPVANTATNGGTAPAPPGATPTGTGGTAANPAAASTGEQQKAGTRQVERPRVPGDDD